MGVCFYLRQPVVLRSSKEDWNLTLWSSRCETLLQPECGITTVLVSVVSASRMMVIFTASHEDRFQRTPGGAGPQISKINKNQSKLHLDGLKLLPIHHFYQETGHNIIMTLARSNKCCKKETFFINFSISAKVSERRAVRCRTFLKVLCQTEPSVASRRFLFSHGLPLPVSKHVLPASVCCAGDTSHRPADPR